MERDKSASVRWIPSDDPLKTHSKIVHCQDGVSVESGLTSMELLKRAKEVALIKEDFEVAALIRECIEEVDSLRNPSPSIRLR